VSFGLKIEQQLRICLGINGAVGAEFRRTLRLNDDQDLTAPTSTTSETKAPFSEVQRWSRGCYPWWEFGDMRAVWLLAATCSLAAAEDPRELVRHAVQLMDQNLAIARNYTFLERTEIRELDSNSRVTSRKVMLYDVTLLEGSPYLRLVGKDDHPLSPAEERMEQKKLQDNIAERQKESPEQHARRIADWEKKQQRARGPLTEIPEGFDFRMAGEEQVNGRAAWVIEGTPRPGYHARSTLAKFFPKLSGKLWIDKADHQWVRFEGEVTGTISVGLFLARLNQGARLSIEMTRINDEVWLPKRILANGTGRLALVKQLRVEDDTSYSNYRKFQAESRIVAVAPQP